MSFEQELNNVELEKKREEERRDAESRFFVALNNVAKTSDGRKVLKVIMSLAPIDEEVFSPDNPMQTAFNCGRRSITVEIVRFLKSSISQDMLENIEKEVI